MNDTLNVFEQHESEVRSYCRSYPTVFTHAKGSIMTDVDGREYIDFFNGAGSLNYGHNNTYIKGKILDYLSSDRIIHALDMYTPAKADFLTYFQEQILKPRGLNYKVQFPGPTGTNGVEAALKLARKVTGRTNIWCLMGCYHGMTLGALALTSDRDSRAGGGLPLTHVTHIPAPYMFPQLDTVRYMETLLTDDHSGVDLPAAFIIETVQAEGGIYPFDAQWLREVEKLCRKHGIILIVDDIQIGCGRTGSFFSFERAGIVPDMVILSKSIGGIGMPMALTLFKPELDIWSPGEHNGTFRGNQLAMVAGKAGLEFMLDNSVEDQVKTKEPIVSAFLREKIQPLAEQIETRGIGLIWGIDLKDGAMAKKVVRRCFETGLVIELAGRENAVLKVLPALTIPEKLLERGLKTLYQAISGVL